ncbi:Ig-like domain-containing protein [Tahibacter amnicola]|uniref:Ig-like domain-containing protein n=1 Tax=Tahibacter amnicola TaxID=2976241 RepID=A0ABY6BKJ1_9GAMM|nr:Ig-like domain-containing protein [Tahibacter amnicola]UXI70292.1 Ig-like domain-containing protein [Tahibacter amnicola]
MRWPGLKKRTMACVSAAILISPLTAQADHLQLVTLGHPFAYGTQGELPSGSPSVSADGRYVLFESAASNLVPNDRNGASDIFLRDNERNTLSIVSLTDRNGAIAGDSTESSISADGRYVVFCSAAPNVVTGIAPLIPRTQCYRRDTTLGVTQLVTARDYAIPGDNDSRRPTLSADGRFVTFVSLARNLADGNTGPHQKLFLRDMDSPSVTREDVNALGEGGNQYPQSAMISATGRFIVFDSRADNLVAGDTNGASDVFLRDRETGAVERISVTTEGAGANRGSYDPVITPDGRYVLFSSLASNLDPRTDQGIFVRDRVAQTTALVSIGFAGEAIVGNYWDRPRISDDGTTVAFATSASLGPGYGAEHFRILVRNLQSGQTTLASDNPAANPWALHPAMTANGRVVYFDSTSTSLVNGDTNQARDVFERDVSTGIVRRISESVDGPIETGANGASTLPALSRNGRYLAFRSAATNLSGATNPAGAIYLATLETQSVRSLVPSSPSQLHGQLAISSSGRFVGFDSEADLIAGDAHTGKDLYVVDTSTGQLESLNIPAPAVTFPFHNASLALSDDGRYVVHLAAVREGDHGMRDRVFLTDRVARMTRRIDEHGSAGWDDKSATRIGISTDGRYVVYSSGANSLVGDDFNNTSDVFRYDRTLGTTRLISRAANGFTANGPSTGSRISDDARFIVYVSSASNLVPGDTNNAADIFVFDADSGSAARLTLTANATALNAPVTELAISNNGRTVAFTSAASNVVAGDTNGAADIFLHDRDTGETRLVTASVSHGAGNGAANSVSLSADGRRLAFAGAAWNWVDGDHNGSRSDVFRYIVAPSPTAITVVSAEPAQPVVGEPQVLTLRLDANGGEPQGSVLVREGSQVLCGPLPVIDGLARCELRMLTAGVHALSGEFTSGSNLFDSSQVAVNQVVSPAATALRVDTLPAVVRPGQGTLVRVDLDVQLPGSGVPTGTITVARDRGGDQCVIQLPATQCELPAGGAGRYRVSARYAGDSNYQASSVDAGEQFINTAPIARHDQFVTYEDTPLTLPAANGVLANDEDPDGDPLQVVTTVNGSGIGGEIALQADGSVYYAPPADSSGSDEFGYGIDDGYEAASASVRFQVLPVNDAPGFALSGDQLWPAGAAGPRELPAYAHSVRLGPADESGQQVAGWLVRVDDPANVVDDLSIAHDGTLRYTLTGNCGSVSVAVAVRDDGGTANGGMDTSPEQLFQVSVAAGVNLVATLRRVAHVTADEVQLTYTARIENQGTGAAHGTQVRATLSGNLLNATWTCEATANATCAAAGSGAISDEVDIAPGAALVYTVSTSVPAGGDAHVEVSLEALPIASEPDIDVSDNRATDSAVIGLFADGFESH